MAICRDRPCPAGKTLGWAAGICSSIAQQPWEFTRIIAKFDPSNADPNHQTTNPVTHGPTRQTEQPPTDGPTQGPTQGPTEAPTPAPTAGPTSAPPTVDCANTHGEQYFPYAGDCHKYIRCYGGVQHIEVCPGDLLFDLKLHICNWPADVNRPECKH